MSHLGVEGLSWEEIQKVDAWNLQNSYGNYDGSSNVECLVLRLEFKHFVSELVGKPDILRQM